MLVGRKIRFPSWCYYLGVHDSNTTSLMSAIKQTKQSIPVYYSAQRQLRTLFTSTAEIHCGIESGSCLPGAGFPGGYP